LQPSPEPEYDVKTPALRLEKQLAGWLPQGTPTGSIILCALLPSVVFKVLLRYAVHCYGPPNPSPNKTDWGMEQNFSHHTKTELPAAGIHAAAALGRSAFLR
jgi:hypothetical protein